MLKTVLSLLGKSFEGVLRSKMGVFFDWEKGMVRLTESECHSLCRDAAHTVHPLAGQGLNQGLADVECLARVIEQSLLSGSDIGKPWTKLSIFLGTLSNHFI